MVMTQVTPTQKCQGWVKAAMLGLETILLTMTFLLSLLEVAVMELVLWAQAPTLFPLFPSPCLERIHVDWGWRPSLERGGVRVRKGSTRPPSYFPRVVAYDFQET